MIYIALYLAAIIAANLTIATFGAAFAPLVALAFIGLNLASRDRLHDLWGARTARNMGLLILVGGVMSYALNAGAGRIALASVAAFAVSEALDAVVYHLRRHRPYLIRSNTSNLFGAAADSVIFPVLAFGGFPLGVILLQFAAKVFGGFIWSLGLNWMMRRELRQARNNVHKYV